MADNKIFLGLDIGTNSVGWAVTDEEYKLRKYKSNLMWGVHLFDEAEQSANRRMFRTARRRLDRRQQRICLLQEFFASEILKADPRFFFRLKESALLPEDSENRKRNTYFDDKDYGDKEYFRDYPTMHHLICELMDNPAPHDVRLVYYACAYILAHRGHFLFSVSKDNIDNITEFGSIYKDFYIALTELCDTPAFDENASAMEELLKMHISITAKEKELKQLLFGGKVPKAEEGDAVNYDQLIKLISGKDGVKLSDLFIKDEYKDLEKNTVCVRKADFSETLESLEGQIDELHFALLVNVKALYDWSLLVDILHGHKMISHSKVEIYERHKADLMMLKVLVKKYLSQKDYNSIFREAGDKANYASYVYNRKNLPDRKVSNKFRQNDSSNDRKSQEAFCKFLKPYLEKMRVSDDDKPAYADILEKCKNSELCPKQVTTDNRVIPYQLYYAELKAILENASRYLPFLNKKDEYGTVAEKILQIMEFRIPYYTGPLVDETGSKNAWLKRKADGKIYPWNFAEIVDEEKSEEEFIRRMTCKCTYLAGEDVLPKYSLLYSKFMVLNEINNIKVNGEPISAELKQQLYTDKFVNSSAKVTKKKIAEYFRSIGAYTGEIEVSGIDDIIKSSLRSYHDFKRMLENGVLTEAEAEDIILRITVTTDTGRLKRWLKANYPKLTEEQVRFLSKLKYKDYGRLSRRFLEELLSMDTETGEITDDRNIITMLWDTNDNLMQILSSKYRYSEAVEFFNKEYYGKPENHKTISERLEQMYIPTSVRRAVTRTLDIVKELKHVLKAAPDKIFIEMSRGEGETPKGKRTVSRKDKILDCLDKANPDDIDILKSQLEGCDDGMLRSEKYYLYFMQLGKCAYTGKAISFEEIGNEQIWNIDHIWPQAKVKDDSIDNKVLVDSRVNGDKGDKYPISADIRNKMAGFWHFLREKDLMSEKKYLRLIRSTSFTEEELSGFIARQLVETRQSTKAVATLLKELFPETEIVYVKAGLVSEFRQEKGMPKCREINDLHHAKDAYLNIVMGNVYNVRFTNDPLNFIRKERNNYSIKLTTLLDRRIERNSETAWEPSSSFDTVKKMMSKNSIRYVRYAYKRKGGLFNQMPERKKEGLIPRKKGLDTAKYGGYNNATASFFSVIKAKNDIVIIPINLMDYDRFLLFENEAVDIAMAALSEFYPERKMSRITKEDISFPLKQRIIKINTLLEIDGFRVNVCSKDSKGKYLSVSSAVSLVVDITHNDYIKKLESFMKKHDKDKNIIVNSFSGITIEDNIDLFDYLAEKCCSAPFSRWNKFKEAGDILQKGRSLFISEDVTNQVCDLMKILSILKTGRSGNCDLLFVGGVANFNTVRFNSTLDSKKCKEVYIIDQSPTGLYEKKSVNLLTL